MFAELAGKPMQFETGTATRYNQTNFIVLGAILETLYGMSYRQSSPSASSSRSG